MNATTIVLAQQGRQHARRRLSGVVVLLACLFTAISLPAQTGISNEGNLRGEWSGTLSYAVNDIVTYNGSTFTNISPTAPITAPSTANLFDLNAVSSGVVISAADGSEIGFGGFQSTGYVNVTGLTSFVTNITIGIFAPYGIGFYDVNKRWVSSSFLNGDGYFPAGVPIAVPSGASYVRFWWQNVRMGTTLDQAVVNAGTILQTTYSAFGSTGAPSIPPVTPCASPTDTTHWTALKTGTSLSGPWAGKKMFMLGDSIVALNTAVALQIATKIGASLSGHGASAPGVDAFSGRGFSSFQNGQGPNGFVPLSASVIADVDLMVIALGTNQDSAQGLGSVLDAPSSSGSMSAQMRLMLETIMGWKPGMRVVVVGPYQSNRYNAAAGVDGLQGIWGSSAITPNQQSLATLQSINAQMKAVCNLYSLPYIDMYNESGLNFSTSALWLVDGLHPNNAGYSTMYVPYISAQLQRFVQQ